MSFRRFHLYVLLDALLMMLGFATLTMSSIARDELVSFFFVTPETYEWGYIAYTSGLFVAFFLGRSKYFERNFKKGVMLSVLFAAIPQILIPLIPFFKLFLILRFIQGFIIALVPLFSTQVGELFREERAFAKGIILGGIFLGGIFGSLSGNYLVSLIGWRLSFILTGILMLIGLLIWWALVEDLKGAIEERRGSPWRLPFTYIWGLSLFFALWVVFTIQGLLPSTAFNLGLSRSDVSALSTLLSASKVFWSILIGYLTYRISIGAQSNRELFSKACLMMISSYALGFLGLLITSHAIKSGDHQLFYISLFLCGAIQGVAPVFWSTPAVIFPESMVASGAFAIGLVSNSANAIGPFVTKILVQRGLLLGWYVLAAAPLFGIFFTTLSMKMRMPSESQDL